MGRKQKGAAQHEGEPRDDPDAQIAQHHLAQQRRPAEDQEGAGAAHHEHADQDEAVEQARAEILRPPARRVIAVLLHPAAIGSHQLAGDVVEPQSRGEEGRDEGKNAQNPLLLELDQQDVPGAFELRRYPGQGRQHPIEVLFDVCQCGGERRAIDQVQGWLGLRLRLGLRFEPGLHFRLGQELDQLADFFRRRLLGQDRSRSRCQQEQSRQQGCQHGQDPCVK